MALVLVCMILALSGCTSGSQDKSGDDTDLNTKKGKITLNIVSGSENKELAPLLESFVKKEKIDLNIEYKGSLDIMRSLQSGASEYDGVWPASSLWLTLGDTEHKVKHIESVSITPVVLVLGNPWQNPWVLLKKTSRWPISSKQPVPGN